MLPIVVAFAISGVVCGLAFLVTYMSHHPWLIPSLPVLLPRAAAALPAGPVYCAASGRWRDPATRRFVKAPR